MMFRPVAIRSRFNLYLVVTLLMLGWFQLHHELAEHLEHPDQGCVVCIYTGHLGDGAMTGITSLLPFHNPPLPYLVPGYTAPVLAQPFHFALSQRGPPVTPV